MVKSSIKYPFCSLSWGAQGLYYWIKNNPKTTFSGILEGSSGGKATCQAAIRELKEKGFLTTERVAVKGKRQDGASPFKSTYKILRINR